MNSTLSSRLYADVYKYNFVSIKRRRQTPTIDRRQSILTHRQALCIRRCMHYLKFTSRSVATLSTKFILTFNDNGVPNVNRFLQHPQIVFKFKHIHKMERARVDIKLRSTQFILTARR